MFGWFEQKKPKTLNEAYEAAFGKPMESSDLRMAVIRSVEEDAKVAAFLEQRKKEAEQNMNFTKDLQAEQYQRFKEQNLSPIETIKAQKAFVDSERDYVSEQAREKRAWENNLALNKIYTDLADSNNKQLNNMVGNWLTHSPYA